jgi:TrmH family RNA methyltransferase
MAKPQRLTSAANRLLKEIRRAVDRGILTPDGCCVAETFHLLEEALRSPCEIKSILAADSALAQVERLLEQRPELRVFVLPDQLLERLSATGSSQGVLCLVRPPDWTVDDAFRGSTVTVVIDGLQDPGNAGAIVRAAEAFGAGGVLFLRGSVNPYGAKAVRASAGSVFRLPIHHGLDHVSVRDAVARRGLVLYAAAAGAGTPAGRADLTRNCAILIGSEGRGWRRENWPEATAIQIPTRCVESLNAAMAAGILLYEAQRQREANP